MSNLAIIPYSPSRTFAHNLVSGVASSTIAAAPNLLFTLNNYNDSGDFFTTCKSFETSAYKWKVCTSTISPFAYAVVTFTALVFLRTIIGQTLPTQTRKPYYRAIIEYPTNKAAQKPSLDILALKRSA